MNQYMRDSQGAISHMIVLNSLSDPDSGSASVVTQNMKHPALSLVDHCQCFATLTKRPVSSSPVSGVEAVLHSEIAHHLDGLTCCGAALQSNLGDQPCFHSRQATS